ncbi:MAG TPA: ABC transporter ATP-binding protein, partial [Candidatus Dormibacteraeota bacterium]|nr:ABC transporter ATP-binding protein [Candidatus Dormibacteraeota bacterium]
MPAVDLRDIHKTFRIPHEVHTTLTERLLSGFRRTSYERFEALRGVDLVIEQGSFVGIIGGNGSGKSTLLKIISGLLPPDRGEVHVDGSMSALLELGLGFSNELTVRENVELYAAVLGYPRREVAQRVDEAIHFADLDRFRDAKLKNLSTGMRARLGFATALQAESDIMLLDEILAVGDADFQLKCLHVFEDLKQRRKTMVLVSHDLGQVQRFCDEAVWLDHGRIAAQGDPDAVIAAYLSTVGREQAAEAAPARAQAGGTHVWGEGQMRVLRGWVENEAGRSVGRVRCGDTATLVIECEALEDVDAPVLGLGVNAADGFPVYGDTSDALGIQSPPLAAGQRIEWRVRIVAAMRNGRYRVSVGLADKDSTRFYDLVDTLIEFVVHGGLGRHTGADMHGRISYADLQSHVSFRVGAADAAATPDPIVRQQKGGAR